MTRLSYVDEAPDGPWSTGNVSAVNNVDKGVFDSIRMLADGRFGGGSDVIFDLRNGGVGLGRISPQVPRDVLRRVESVRKAIIAGKIKVPGAT